MVTKEYIEKLIAKNNAQLKRYKDNLEENYLHHFEWVAERIFKLEWKNKTLNDILVLFNDENVNVENAVGNLKERFKNSFRSCFKHRYWFTSILYPRISC